MTKVEKVDGVVGYYIFDLVDADGSNGWDGRLHPSIDEARESLRDPVTREMIRSNERWAILECRVAELDSEPAENLATALSASADRGEVRVVDVRPCGVRYSGGSAAVTARPIA